MKQGTGNVLTGTYSNIKSRTITCNNRKILDLVPLFKKEEKKKLTTLGKQI